jgi:hypothetical protein
MARNPIMKRQSAMMLKIENFDETKLLNSYSGVGINFRNISSDDAVVYSKPSEMEKEG